MATSENAEQGNQFLLNFLNKTLDSGTAEVEALRAKLAMTYRVIVVLSVIMFFTGITLISTPILAAFNIIDNIHDPASLQSFIPVIAGLADLIVLFLARPIEQIHNLMGDMTQLTLSINSFRYQVGLRLLESDLEKHETVGQAAEHIRLAAESSMSQIEKYFAAMKKN